MATLREIKRRITGVKSTSKITQAMKMVSAAKMRRAQNAIIAARPYVIKLNEIMSNLVGAVGENYTHPVLRKTDDVRNIAIIVIGSDRGLAGSFNAQLFRGLKNVIDERISKEAPHANINIIPVGKRPVSFYSKQNYNILHKYNDFFADLRFEKAKDIVSNLKNLFIEGKLDRVYIYFNKFINTLRQEPDLQQLLPISPANADDKKFNIDYIFEPDQKSILDELLPKLLDIQLWRTLLESNAAEQAARMMAMDNATINAKEIIRSLELVYNKERQASITKEMLEIVGGANALKQG